VWPSVLFIIYDDIGKRVDTREVAHWITCIAALQAGQTRGTQWYSSKCEKRVFFNRIHHDKYKYKYKYCPIQKIDRNIRKTRTMHKSRCLVLLSVLTSNETATKVCRTRCHTACSDALPELNVAIAAGACKLTGTNEAVPPPLPPLPPPPLVVEVVRVPTAGIIGSSPY
jgi:hypothetical protein